MFLEIQSKADKAQCLDGKNKTRVFIIYISLRSLRADTRLIVSAYSIYPELSHLLSRVILTLCLSFLFSISSMKKVEVASPSRFGFVAIIISSLFSESSILRNSEEKFRSHTNTPLIGEIAPPSI